MGAAEELEIVIAPVCAALGVELFDLECRPGVLQVTVERSGGLDLDALAEVSRAISSALDEADGPGPAEGYELEVTTPGLERRLRRPDHFARAIGQRVAVRTRPGTAGERRVEGELTSADSAGIVVAAGTQDRALAYDDIERAHTVFDWRAALVVSRDDGEVRAEQCSAITRERATRS